MYTLNIYFLVLYAPLSCFISPFKFGSLKFILITMHYLFFPTDSYHSSSQLCALSWPFRQPWISRMSQDPTITQRMLSALFFQYTETEVKTYLTKCYKISF